MVSLPFLLGHHIRQYNPMEIVKWWGVNSHHDILIIIYFDPALITLYSWLDIIPFLFVAITLNVFLHSLSFFIICFKRWVTFWQRWKNLQNWRIASIISFIKPFINLCDIVNNKRLKSIYFLWGKILVATVALLHYSL